MRRRYQVIRRAAGAYVAGTYTLPAEPAPVGILASLQPATPSDYERTEAGTEGRRVKALFRIYTKANLTVAGDGDMPGDIFINEQGKRLLIIGKAERNVLRSSVSHNRYLAVAEIEHVNGEPTL